ncbi:hypothetical protein [Treponema zioleckii]|uniref:hypothetical protein n=1 Tax=Treponema zioleckii TaxID=331680 RepID=UPI00168B2DE6|nr:hypothetical protein [Treponema zioleckii]
MSNNNKTYFYIAANLAMFVPVPGRMAYGIILILLFNIQMLFVTLLLHALRHMNLTNLRNTLVAVEIIAFTILYKQLLIIFCPVIALTLGFAIYLPTLSSLAFEFFFLKEFGHLKAHFIEILKMCGIITLNTLVYFLLRDLIGFGTLTLPAWKRMLVLNLPYSLETTSAGVFFATVPGSLCLVSILLVFLAYIRTKFSILKNLPKTFRSGNKSLSDASEESDAFWNEEEQK